MKRKKVTALCMGAAFVFASLGTGPAFVSAAETEEGPVIEAPAETPTMEETTPVPETDPAPVQAPDSPAQPPEAETSPAQDLPPEASTENRESESLAQTEHESSTSTQTPETAPQTEGNHSTRIPENPPEEKTISNSDIVDAGEEDWESLEDETEDGLSDDSDTDESGGRQSGYFWDESWYVAEDFRFTKVDKELALVIRQGGIYVLEEKDMSSKRIGEIPYLGALCILEDLKDGWVYLESGNVRGFAPKASLMEGRKASSMISLVGESAMTQGKMLCESADNKAFTYTRTTSYDVIAAKTCALCLASGFIYEYPDAESRHIGDMKSGSLVYLLVMDGDWYFVESGDVRGFVPKKALLTGNGANDIVLDLGEEEAPLAKELISPEDNRSVYYTLTSVKSASSGIANDLCKKALSYVGTLPYVYGGTSLIDGCDCSGFAWSIYSSFGINLPRTAQEMGANGQEVDGIGNAKPGDIVYYASGPHVGIYLGDGKVVQCSGNETNTYDNPGPGPEVSSADYMPITSIRRYLIVRDHFGTSADHRTDDTPYTKEQLETIWAIVAQEDNGSYEGALAVISSAMNRTESARWGYEGCNAYMQLTASGQYCYSMDSYWVPRLHGNVPEYVKEAVNDCLKKGIRNHAFTSFRSRRGKITGSEAVQIGGNWYFGS